MKKLIVLFAALLAVMFVAPAFAADNLDLSGQFRVRMFDRDGMAFTEDNDANWFDQRMRLQAKVKASDNAYVVIRADLGEGTWGLNYSSLDGGAARPGNQDTDSYFNTIHFDRLYGVYSAEMWELTIGQQYVGLGIAEVVDANPTAIKLRLKLGAVEPSLIYAKNDENGSTDDDGFTTRTNFVIDQDPTSATYGTLIRAAQEDVEDDEFYGINLSFDAMGFDSNAYYAKADNGDDTDLWVVGLHTTGKLGMVNLAAELDILGGDAGAGVDFEGTNFYLKGDADLSDAFNVGAEFLYAPGQDGGDVQATSLTDWGSFTVFDTNAPCATDVVTSDANPFDFTNNSAGVVGGSLFGSYQINEPFSVGAKLAYLTPEEDDNTNVDDDLSFSIWANYALGSNTSLMVLYNITSRDFDVDPGNDDDWNTLYARFMINF